MSQLTLGLTLSSLNRPLRPALQLASRLGVRGVQVDAVGELAPDALSQTGRKDFRHLLRSFDLELTAVNCPLRHGFDVEQNLEGRIAHVRKVMTLAYDLGPRIVTVAAGRVPADDSASAPLFLDALTTLGRHGDRTGTTLALEAGWEPAAALKAFLGRLTCGGLAVNVDPAALLMGGSDPAEAVREFLTLLVHTNARDARPGRDRVMQEVPLGHGDVDWNAYLGALEEVGYRSWLTIRRGPCADPARDVENAVAFLRRLVG